jgi:cysteine-rich repeat protein
MDKRAVWLVAAALGIAVIVPTTKRSAGAVDSCNARVNSLKASCKADARAAGLRGRALSSVTKACNAIGRREKRACRTRAVGLRKRDITGGVGVTTDKSDYQPGDVIVLTGTGWQPGEAVSMVLSVDPQMHPDVSLSSVADDSGSFTNTDYIVQDSDLGVTFTLTATGQSSGLTALTAGFTDDKPICGDGITNGSEECDDGGTVGGDGCSATCTIEHAVVTSVLGETTADCVAGPTSNQQVQTWDVAQGHTYRVELSGVSDCGNGGTDATIAVLVKSSDTGNMCLTASRVSTGVYTFDVTMPGNACNTYPIAYCSCDPSAAILAGGPDGDHQSHLRAADFDGSCGKTGDDTDCTVACLGTLQVCKYNDSNASGTNNGESALAGWTMTLSSTDPNFVSSSQVTTLDGGGCVTWSDLPGGDQIIYTVTETASSSSLWLNTDPGPLCQFPTCNTNCVADQCTTVSLSTTLACAKNTPLDFGNLCLGKCGGLTLGYWSNANGFATLKDKDEPPPYLSKEFGLLSGLQLRDAAGNDFNPSCFCGPKKTDCPGSVSPDCGSTSGNFRTWLLKASATNMAYMLSAQLAAMELNVESGSASGSTLVYAPSCGNTGIGGNNFITISDLMAAANAALYDGNTPSGDPNRASQECLKNALDRANNNLNCVQANGCS